MIAVALPEAGLIGIEDREPTNPFHGLPEVEMGNHQTQREAVLQIQRFAVKGVREEVALPEEVVDRKVRREPVLRPQRARAYAFDDAVQQLPQRANRDPFPSGVEFRPLRDAVNVGGDIAHSAANGTRPRSR